MIELLYFTGKDCGVCYVLKPKLREAIENEFSDRVQFTEIDIEENREMAAQNMVFTLPVVIITYEGKETKRFARAFGVNQVVDYLKSLISQVA